MPARLMLTYTIFTVDRERLYINYLDVWGRGVEGGRS